LLDDVQVTPVSKVPTSGPVPPAWGIDTLDQLVPFQWMARFSPVPPAPKYSSIAQQFFRQVHAMPPVLATRGFRGVATTDQRAPFQCCAAVFPAVQQFLAEVQARPLEPNSRLGAAATDQRRPFQWKASPFPSLFPTIRQSVGDTHARPARALARLSGRATADQSFPFHRRITARPLPFPSSRPMAWHSLRAGHWTANNEASLSASGSLTRDQVCPFQCRIWPSLV
jgi:hypothetical protein